MSTPIKEQARFEARLSKELKQDFEEAAFLGGYGSLSNFVILTVQEKAKKIIQEKKQIIASERDSQLFFDAITNPEKPSKNLENALDDYNDFIAKSR